MLLTAGKALAAVDLGVGCAIWAVLGIVLTATIAVVMFGEQPDGPSIAGIAIIVVGVTLANVFGRRTSRLLACMSLRGKRRCYLKA